MLPVSTVQGTSHTLISQRRGDRVRSQSQPGPGPFHTPGVCVYVCVCVPGFLLSGLLLQFWPGIRRIPNSHRLWAQPHPQTPCISSLCRHGAEGGTGRTGLGQGEGQELTSLCLAGSLRTRLGPGQEGTWRGHQGPEAWLWRRLCSCSRGAYVVPSASLTGRKLPTASLPLGPGLPVLLPWHLQRSGQPWRR